MRRHYAQSMTSWGLLTALSGYQFDMVNRVLTFDPYVHSDEWSCFWSVDEAWGRFPRKFNEVTFEVLYGTLDIAEVRFGRIWWLRAGLTGEEPELLPPAPGADWTRHELSSLDFPGPTSVGDEFTFLLG